MALALAGALGLALLPSLPSLGAPAETATSPAAQDKGALKDKAKSKDAAAKDKAKEKAAAKDKAAKAKATGARTKTKDNIATRAKGPSPAFAVATTSSTPSVEVAAVKEAIAAARKGKSAQAIELQKLMNDPVARKLVEWAVLRSDDSESVEINRYMAFIAENPSWPSIGLLRRRAEATLWSDRLDPAFV